MSIRIRAYVGTFEKKNGEARAMKFARLQDLPEEFLEAKTKGGKTRKLTEGTELVWDLDEKGFRVFNWNTTKGDVSQIENFSLDSLD
tara:strand:- start:48 stop:308 length:261 start_codon:yes stop_codon:yes gene_type:complete